MKKSEMISRPEWDEHNFGGHPYPGDESPGHFQLPLCASLTEQCKQSFGTSGMRKGIPHLPEKWDQPVPNSLRIGVVALQLSPQELFLDKYPQSENPDDNAREQSGCV